MAWLCKEHAKAALAADTERSQQGLQRIEVENLRRYVVARKLLHSRSGLFTIEQLAEALQGYGYRSIKDRSNRAKFKKKLATELSESLFFERVNADTYRFIGEAALTIEQRAVTRRRRIEVPDTALAKKSRFRDFVIGVTAYGNDISNATLAQMFGVTVRRVQFATAANDRRGWFEKTPRYVIERARTLKKAQERSNELWAVHRICAPVVEYEQNKFAIRVNDTNHYKVLMLSRWKGKRLTKAQTQPMKTKQWERWHKSPFRGGMLANYENQKDIQKRVGGGMRCEVAVFNKVLRTLEEFTVDNSVLFN